MKKISYLLFTFIFSILFAINVDALANPTYHYTEQKIDGKVMYCVDGGMGMVSEATIKSACSISKIEGLDGLDAVFNELQLSDHQKQATLRYLADKAGISKSNRAAQKQAIDWVNADAQAGLKAKIQNMKIEVKDSSFIKEVGAPTYSGNMATQTMKITAAKPGTLQVTGGTSSISSFGAGTTTFTVTAPVAGNCVGANVTIKALMSVSASTKVPNSGSDDGAGYYYIDCGTNVQSYIVSFDHNPGDGDSDGGSKKISKSGTVPKSYTLHIPDPNCDCRGESNAFCTDCAENVTAGDTTKNLVACANADSFETYCNLKIKKEEVGENPFCKVYCTEQITYELPGQIATKAGRYFKLKRGWDIEKDDPNNNDPTGNGNVAISGTRSCFTNKVDREKYVNLIKEEQQKLVEKYNEYLKNKAFQEAIDAKKYDEHVDSCVGGTYINNKGKVANCTGGATYKWYDVTVTYDVYEITGWNNKTGEPKFKVNKNGGTATSDWWGEKTTGMATSCSGSTSVCSTTKKSQPNYKSAPPSNSAITQLIEQYRKCFDYSNNYCFEPTAKFSYEEPYTFMNGSLGVLKTDVPQSDAHYYQSVDESTYKDGVDDPDAFRQKEYLTNVGESTLSTDPYDVKNTLYVMKEVKDARRIFNTSTSEVSTYHPYGTISQGQCDPNDKLADPANCRYLGWVFPVALETTKTTGISNYTLKFENLGVDGSDKCEKDHMGRISNGDNACLATKASQGCPPDYTCNYKTTSCPECDIECECPKGDTRCEKRDKVCYWKKRPGCKDCEVTCDGCIWHNGDIAISYKPISLSKVFKTSEGEKIPSNWTDENASKVIDHIEANQEEIFNPSYYKSEQEYGGKKTYYKIIIDPSLGGFIRTYNAKSSGYTNDTLVCHEGKICESKFLRDLAKKYSSNVILPKIK